MILIFNYLCSIFSRIEKKKIQINNYQQYRNSIEIHRMNQQFRLQERNQANYSHRLQEWDEVNYSQSNKRVPIQRWGHQIVQRKHYQEIYLFGGYGSDKSSDGKYFNDLWVFSIKNYTWSQVKATGQKPQIKSNFSFHYNDASDQIVLFGGGSNQKVRFNSVFMFDCKIKHWSKYNPQSSQQAPWERTYHTSQLVNQYLIIHGGESVSNFDLDDTWVFNIITKKWKALQFDQKSKMPLRRRFHSSFIWNNYMYILGGCNHHYSLIGDAYRVNLTNLFEKDQYTGYHWQCVIPYNNLLQRWGHTCSIIEGKVYITYGRISLYADSNDTIVIDLQKHQIKMHHVSKQNLPKARRKHSSVVINNCILIFGGYNGKYLNDFHFLKIQNQEENIQSKMNVQLHSNFKDLEIKISELQSRIVQNIDIKLTKNGRYIQSVKSNEKSLKNNLFFKNLINYSSKNQINFQLPQFFTTLIYRILNICLNYNLLLIPQIKNIDFYKKFLQSCDYINCSYIQQALQNQLIIYINQDNYQFAFNLGIQLNLKKLINKAAEIYIQNKCQVKQFNYLEKCNIQSQCKLQQENILQLQDSINIKRKKAIEQAYKKKKFIIQQAQLKQSNIHFLLKTFRKIKQIFTNSPKRQNSSTNSVIAKQKKNKKGCASKIFDSLLKLCSNSTNEQNEQE